MSFFESGWIYFQGKVFWTIVEVSALVIIAGFFYATMSMDSYLLKKSRIYRKLKGQDYK